MLIKLTKEQRREVKHYLLNWYKENNAIRRVSQIEVHREFYAFIGSLGYGQAQVAAGRRAKKPRYAELGMTRPAGPPTDEEIARYRELTDGGDLGRDGLVLNILLFDNDLITDRSAAITYKGLTDLYSKYLDRANDLNHSFDVLDARGRIIELALGDDPSTELHEDFPRRAMAQINPIVNSNYTALWARVAFPKLSQDTIVERIHKGLIKDVSIAFSHRETLCSECLKPMELDMCGFSWCEEHGFPGGRTDDGRLVVGVINEIQDAFTFGLVSDGAVKRAGIVLDPNTDGSAANASTFKEATNLVTKEEGTE